MKDDVIRKILAEDLHEGDLLLIGIDAGDVLFQLRKLVSQGKIPAINVLFVLDPNEIKLLHLGQGEKEWQSCRNRSQD